MSRRPLKRLPQLRRLQTENTQSQMPDPFIHARGWAARGWAARGRRDTGAHWLTALVKRHVLHLCTSTPTCWSCPSMVFSPDTTVWCEAHKGALVLWPLQGDAITPRKRTTNNTFVCARLCSRQHCSLGQEPDAERAQGQMSQQNALRTRAHCYCADLGASHTPWAALLC